MKILFLVIVYNNEQEVVEFLEQIDTFRTKNFHDLEVYITDNTGQFKYSDITHIKTPCTICSPGKNLGYLNGCGFAFDQYLAQNPVPDWVSISNTDLELPSDYLSILNDIPADTGQVSPRVVKHNGIVQNPHILSRPSRQYYIKQRLIHFNSLVGALYIWGSGRRRNQAGKPASLAKFESSAGHSIYCAHGSIFFLSKNFFVRGGIINNAPFLYGEEIYIGEQLVERQLGSLCRLEFTVIHNAHATSKFVSLRAKSKLFRASFKLLYQKYRAVGVEQ